MLKVLFIVPKYPCLSETFIRREINGIRQHNVQVFIYALRYEKYSSKDLVQKEFLLYRNDISILSALKSLFQIIIKNSFPCFEFCIYVLSYLRSPIYFLKLLRNSFYVFYLSLLIQKHSINFIHAHFADMATDIALLLNKVTGVPFTFSMHARDIFVRSWKLSLKCSSADAVVTCSQYAAGLLRDWTAASNVKNIYHGIDPSDSVWQEIFESRIRQFEKYYTQPSELKLLAIGRLVSKKGFSVLVEALNILKEDQIKFNCKIIGKGRGKNTLRKMIHDLHLEKSVDLVGLLPFTSVLKELQNCHLLIVPSVIDKDGDRDNIPNVILEAQALGVPVLASDLPSIREVVKHKETGFLVQAGEHDMLAKEIRSIFSNGYDLKPILIKAREQIEQKFDVVKNTRKMVQIWCEKSKDNHGTTNLFKAIGIMSHYISFHKLPICPYLSFNYENRDKHNID